MPSQLCLAGLCVLALSICFANSAPACPSNSLEVVTNTGTIVGMVNGTTPHVRQFLGVPFAQPPTEDLRWLPPVALPQEPKTYTDASHFSLNCPQYESTIPSLYNKIVREYFIQGPSGEDCLTLSIWSPAQVAQKVPVFIWLYGGGLQTGGSTVPYQDPAQWVQRTQKHIVVSVQYRLNIFGFPNAPGLSSQNLGFLDQRLAIEWLQQNIAAFGGDPERMVLWGQSAGAQSTDVQNFAFPDNPIVTGFISDSGAVSPTTVSADYGHTNFTFVAKQFNCSGTDILPCMRNVSMSDIIAFLKSYQDSQVSPSIAFSSIPDEVVYFSNYTQRLLDGKVSDKPSIFGVNDIDGISFAPFPTNYTTTGPNITDAELLFQSMFLCPEAADNTYRSYINRTTYRYQYQGNFSNVSPYFWMGAYHSAELPMIFGTSSDFRGPSTPFELETSTTMQDFWLAFAKDPVNGISSMGWPDSTTGNVIAFGGEGQTHRLISLEQLDAPCL